MKNSTCVSRALKPFLYKKWKTVDTNGANFIDKFFDVLNPDYSMEKFTSTINM
jgi:hypothetical protein